MSTTALITWYTCRRCGATTKGPGGGRLPVEATLIAITARPNMLHYAPGGGIPIGLLDIHYCEDGGIGVSDLQGAAPEAQTAC